MPKLSFEVAAFIAGTALTLILVVLDKAGKLKGGLLIALLVMAAALTIPLAYDVASRLAAGTWAAWLRAASVIVVILGYWAVVIWIDPYQHSLTHERVSSLENSWNPPKATEEAKASPLQTIIQLPPRQEFSNAQLGDAAIDLARRLREYQKKNDDEFNSRRRYYTLLLSDPTLTDDKKKQLEASLGTVLQGILSALSAGFPPLRAEALNMQVQLLNRLPPQEKDATVDMVLKYGALAGPDPLYEVSAYFERLARLLP